MNEDSSIKDFIPEDSSKVALDKKHSSVKFETASKDV